jgi:hypothetical protein
LHPALDLETIKKQNQFTAAPRILSDCILRLTLKQSKNKTKSINGCSALPLRLHPALNLETIKE